MNVLEDYILCLKEATERAREAAKGGGEYAEGIYRGLVHASRLLSEIMDQKLNEDADDNKN